MTETDELLNISPKFGKTCIACSRSISLNEKFTYMCSKCKSYFCEECALFYNNLSAQKEDSCPGSKFDVPHGSYMVKITRNIKEYDKKGVTIEEMEQKRNNEQKSTIKLLNNKKTTPPKIMDDSNEQPSSQKKSKVKILDD